MHADVFVNLMLNTCLMLVYEGQLQQIEAASNDY